MNLATIIEHFDKLLWGWPQISILLGTHLFMSVRTGFIQKNIFKAIKLSVTKDPDAPGDVSQFGALTTALASTVGTANIIWVCGIAAGSLAELKIIWNIADILNGLMTIPNIVAVLLLSGTIARETKKYAGSHLDDKDETEIPVIQNSKKGILM